MSDDLIKRLHKYAPDSLDGNLRGPALEAAAALAERDAEIERLRGVALMAYTEGWVTAGGHHLADSGWQQSEAFAALTSRPKP